MKKTIFILSILSIGLLCFGQNPPKYIKDVYNKIYSSIGSESLEPPKLEIINDALSDYDKNNIACYLPQENIFRIGYKFIDVTRAFGADSNNARSYILSHELAHFFKHKYLREIGTGFASSIDKKAKKTKDSISLSIKEFEADQWAYFYSYISGYKINDIAPRLLDTLYKLYKIPEKLDGYPPLNERKYYAKAAKEKMQSMCDVFDFANLSLMSGEYQMAEVIYSAIYEEGFKSREIRSNLGVAHLLKAIQMIDTSDFKYTLPIKVDFNSRLDQNTRGGKDDEKIVEALDNAILQFEGAIKIDKEYVIAYFNLSQALWLKAYFTKSNSDDYKFYLTKAKEKSNQDEKILADIEVFEATVNLTSNDTETKIKGSKYLNEMAEKGNLLAGINLRKINKNKSILYPAFVNDLLKSVTPSDFDKINLMDTVFKRTRKLICNEINNSKFNSRKWKYLSISQNHIIVEQHKFKQEKQLTNEEIKQIKSTADNVFYRNSGTYYIFSQLILYLYNNDKCTVQLIK
jgi:hypothetical protein